MKVIILDIDGVLNYAKSKSRLEIDGIGYLGIDSDKMNNLASLVILSEAKIVLSSSWREHYDINKGYHQTDKCGKYLARRLRKHGLKVYDKIGSNYSWRDRGHQIKEWLDEHPEVTDYVILDDEIFLDYYELGLINHVVKTIYNTDEARFAGLTSYLAGCAFRILYGAEFNGPVLDEDFVEAWTCNGKCPIDKYDLLRI